MAGTTAGPDAVDMHSSPGLTGMLAAEWTKLRSVRSTWIMVFLAITLSIGFSSLITMVMGMSFEDLGPGERASFDPLLGINFGLVFGIILLKVLGVTTVTSEYSSGMIRTTLIVVPHRTRVLAAKAAIAGVIGIVVSVTMVIGMFLVSQAILATYGIERASIGDSSVYRFLGVYAVAGGIVYTLIPLSIAFLLRNTAGAVTLTIGMSFLPSMLGAAMPVWIQENILRYLPDVAMDSLAGAISGDSPVYLSQGPAMTTIIVWLVAGLVLATVTLNRRDA